MKERKKIRIPLPQILDKDTETSLENQKEIIVGGDSLLIICGPCVIESEEQIFDHARAIRDIVCGLGLPLIFKSSYDKANRTSMGSFRGVGMKEGLKLLCSIRETLGVPVVTDIHDPHDVEQVAEAVDLLQIPAFLCRQTDLLVSAAKTRKPILIKKGQFVAPMDMQFALEKMEQAGNSQVMLCERGTCFGYRDLVVDFRSLQIMAETGCPVVFDATHSVQVMGGEKGISSGNRRWVPLLARAAVAAGIDALFLEAHRCPDEAPSDGPNMISLEELPKLLAEIKAFDELKRQLSRDSIN